MSPVRQTPVPGGLLFRLGWLPDPLAWVPWEAIGEGRFDDPQRRFRVLYAAAQRRGVFLESLARFRPALEFLARMRAVAEIEEALPAPAIPTCLVP